MISKFRCLIVLCHFIFVSSLYSQQGVVDTTFNAYDDGKLGDGFDSTVRTVSLQMDGKLIVGGDYLNLNGVSTRYLSRLNADGSKDVSFLEGTGFNGNVYSSFVQPNGKIIVGGSFTAYNGSFAGRLIRLNSDGFVDASFNTSVGMSSGIVYDIGLQTDGNSVVVGSFTNYNAIPSNRIARILSNGNIDASFTIGTGANGIVEKVQIQSDGKIILAGRFTIFNGSPCNKMVRLNTDGSVDATFIVGTGFDDDISALCLQSDGKILVGGDFTSYNGVTANKLIRLNADGSVDSNFITGTGFSDSGIVTIKVSSNGAIMVGGSFTGTYNGISVNRLVLLDANGVVNPLFDMGSGPATGTIYTLANAADGSWFTGGSFSVFDSQNQGKLAKIDAIGALDIGFLTSGVGFDNSVLKVLSLPDNKMMAFGSFTKFNGFSSVRMARLLEDGTLDATFNSMGAGANNTIYDAVLQAGNKIVFAGSFTNYNGVSTNKIARILPDGSIDASFAIGTGGNSTIYSLALQPDGKLIIAGNFLTFNSSSVIRVTRLMPDGTIDPSFNVGSGADDVVEKVVLQPDGKIILGGQFTVFGGSPHNHLVRLNADGTIDSGFSVGTGFNKNVYAIALQSDNKLVIGGAFTTYNGVSAKRMVRLNTDGSVDASFLSGTGYSNGEVRAILVQPDDRILAGGTFSGTYNGISVKRMVRLLSTGDLDSTFLVNLNNTLYSICFTPNHNVMIGGKFNSVSGIAKHRVARLKLCTNSSIWNGSAWSNGLPSAEKTLVFDGNEPVLASINACSCSINSGNTVTVLTGNTLGLVFDYAGLGTLVLENNASLCQSEDNVKNTGVIIYKRQTTPIGKFDYTYWSSPVSNQTLYNVSPTTLSDKFFSWDAVADDWFEEAPITKVMEKGVGYIIRGPQENDMTPAIYEASFAGIPNNGSIAVEPIVADKNYLLGNPYPSALDADAFLLQNNTVLDGTLYFWTHNTPIAPQDSDYVYNENDYASYNRVGGTGTTASAKSGVSGINNNNLPNGKIAAGQSFFATSIGSGKVKFNNSMRLIEGATIDNSQFFKVNTKNKAKNAVEKHRVWLNLSNTEGAFKQLLVGYIADATNGFDNAFDGVSFSEISYLDFYSVLDDKKLVIQGKSLPFDEKDSVLLGYSSTIEGLFSISIDQADGLLTNQAVFIRDKKNNVIHNIKEEPYTFATEIGTFNDRFELRYTDKPIMVLDVVDFDKNSEEVVVCMKSKQIKINSFMETMDKVTVYDMAGRQLYHKNQLNCNELLIQNLTSSKKALIVKTLLHNGKTVTKKLIY